MGFKLFSSENMRFKSEITIPNPYAISDFAVEYLVIAGGGAGGWDRGGGGGAGGLLTGNLSVSAGGGALSDLYTCTIGAGATSATTAAVPVRGSNSVFNLVTVYGGGGGVSADTSAGTTQTGGSGGGGAGQVRNAGGAGVYPGSSYISADRQGYDGGTATYAPPFYGAGGGGGSTSAGGNGTSTVGGNGGTGTTSSISGTSVNYAGGGGGGTYGGGTPGTASFGGGNGSASSDGNPGTQNTGGGGGGGGSQPARRGGNGGSGILILKYPNQFTLSNPGGGLTFTTSTDVPNFKVTTFTAGTGNIQFS